MVFALKNTNYGNVCVLQLGYSVQSSTVLTLIYIIFVIISGIRSNAHSELIGINKSYEPNVMLLILYPCTHFSD